MGQVAFDTLQASEELQMAGLTSEQAKAISLVVRKSHEAADVATTADIAEVKRDMADVGKDLAIRFEKTDAQIADIRKDLYTEIADARKETTAQMADLRKDIIRLDKRLDFSEKRFDRLETKFDCLQWFLVVSVLVLLFKEVLPKLWLG